MRCLGQWTPFLSGVLIHCRMDPGQDTLWCNSCCIERMSLSLLETLPGSNRTAPVSGKEGKAEIRQGRIPGGRGSCRAAFMDDVDWPKRLSRSFALPVTRMTPGCNLTAVSVGLSGLRFLNRNRYPFFSLNTVSMAMAAASRSVRRAGVGSH